MEGSPTVRRVVEGDLCTGCGLCASVASGAIRMQDVGGYARPTAIGGVVTDAAEKMIADSCPGAVVEPWAEGARIHPAWGPWREVATGWAIDPEVRFEASSGGGISALAIHALETGLVDSVLQVAADPADPTRNLVVRSRSRADILASAGSRYTASSPLEQIGQALAEGGNMAFVGKPCDASALRRLARHDPRVNAQIPVVLSFFCAGIPNHAGVGRILKAMEVEAAEVESFRYRGQGWPGHAKAVTRSGRTVQMTYAESWGKHLARQVQFRCKICPDAVGGVADVACADAWYGDDEGYPSFQEQDGISLVMTRTEAGERLLASARAAGVIGTEPLDIARIDQMQPGQIRRKRLVVARMAALLVTLQPSPRMSGLQVIQAARSASVRDAAHNFLGTLRRIVTGRK